MPIWKKQKLRTDSRRSWKKFDRKYIRKNIYIIYLKWKKQQQQVWWLMSFDFGPQKYNKLSTEKNIGTSSKNTLSLIFKCKRYIFSILRGL